MSCLIRYNPVGSILLPQGYTRLAYIEGNADAWFSTGIAATANTKYKIKFSAKNKGSWNMMFGRWNTCVIGINSSMHLHINGSNVGAIKEDEICDVTASSSAVYFKSKDSITCNKVSANAVKLAVFGGTNKNDTDNTWGYSKGKIYELKIWEGNTLIRDYVPAKNSSDIAGLLDLVDNSWHPSSTSTLFKAGPECPQGFPTSEYCLVETHSAVTLTSDVIPCYRRSDGKPGKYTLSTNTFTEVLGTMGPSITFGWGEVVNNVRAPLHAIPHNISTGDGRNGEKNGAFYFDGTSYMEVDAGSILPANCTKYTIMMWAKVNTSEVCALFSQRNLISSTSRCVLYDNTDIYYDDGVRSYFSHGVTRNNWNHYAFVRNGSNKYIYVNGQLVNTSSASTAEVFSPVLTIGACLIIDSGVVNLFVGDMKDIKVFDTNLDASGIQQEM